MKSKKCFGRSLCSGALCGALVLLGLSGCGEKLQPPASTTTKVLVVKYEFEENTKEFNISFEDGAGNPVRTFELKNPSNPLGELAQGKRTEAGAQGIVFAIKSSPGCLNGCVGKYCGSTC